MMKKLLLLIVPTLLLQGCVALGVGAAATATKVAIDPRTTGVQIDDEVIESKIKSLIVAENQISTDSRIVPVSYNANVLLIGQVPDDSTKLLAQTLATKVEGVGNIYNEIRVGEKATATQRLNDTSITTQLRSRLIFARDARSSNIKVVTENGEVFLMGKVTSDEADVAVDTARNARGVTRVIKAFEYIN